MSVELPGRYRDEAGAERECTIRGTRPEDLEIACSVRPKPGSRIVCRVPGLGLLSGHAVAGTGGSVRLQLEAGPAQRDRLAARLAWHESRAGGREDRREAVRVVPLRSEIVVLWGGLESVGRLRDISASGAAIDLALRPPIGEPVTVGRRRALVVRHTEGGIGVQFALPLADHDVTESVVL